MMKVNGSGDGQSQIISLDEHKSEGEISKWMKQPLTAWPKKVLIKYLVKLQGIAQKQAETLQQVAPAVDALNKLGETTVGFAQLMQMVIQSHYDDPALPEGEVPVAMQPDVDDRLADMRSLFIQLEHTLRADHDFAEPHTKNHIQEKIVRLAVAGVVMLTGVHAVESQEQDVDTTPAPVQ